ncbi:MAG TPA: site-specific integrase, partial [Gemmatales bacterium]|nr:site-specific integrase [Gemmatales bacterium]
MIAHIALSPVQAMIGNLTFKQNGENAIERPAGLQTKNYYIGAIKHFVAWMVRDGRMTANPLLGLTRFNVATCPITEARRRRTLTPDEVAKVIEATKECSKVYRGLTGQDRAMLYALAIGTGLRASEIAILRPSDFNFDSAPATVRVKACYTKDRKETEQPIIKGVAELLRPYLHRKPHNAPIWPGTWRDKASKMTRKDLALAGVPGRTDEGVFDFHGWRHTYVTFLVSSGIPPKLAQSLARHSDIRLTMDRYAHLQQHERLEAVRKLPSLIPSNLSHTCPHGRDSKAYEVEPVDNVRDDEQNDSYKRASTGIIGLNEQTPMNHRGSTEW